MASVEMATLPVIPERRSRALMEIIDVDSLDDQELFPSQRPSQRRRLEESRNTSSPRSSTVETIVILDSDEEQDASASTSSTQTSSRSRIFSPPPPPQDNSIPPVPRIPARFSGRQSLPMRRLPPPFPSTPPVPDVVRAIERPFEFEEVPTEPVRLRQPSVRAQEPPFPAPAPPSHHLPSMGLGGALISQHRRHAPEEHANRRRAARQRALERERVRENITQQLSHFYHNTLRRLADANRNNRMPGRWSQMDHDTILAHVLAAQDPPEIQFFPPPEARMPEPEESDYDPSYTHPRKALSGFSADFTSSSTPPSTTTSASSSQTIVIVDDSPAASSSTSPSDEATVLLVCAQCLDPLTLNNGKEDPRNRLWGMRCGHVIDGKCMEKLMKPTSIPIAGGEDNVSKELHVSELEPTKNESDENSIRSRLRSYHTGDENPPQPSTLPSFFTRPRNMIRHLFGEQDDDDAVDLLPRLSRGKGKKGKGRAVEPVIEATHEWICPVSGCGKVHISLLIEGKWTMDKESGAIVIYV